MIQEKHRRIDAWDAPLTEAQRWTVFEKARNLPWFAVAEWAAKEFGLAKAPGCSAFYAFRREMQKRDQARRLENAALAAAESRRLADKAGVKKEVADAFIAMGTEIALRTESMDAADKWIKAASSLLSAAQKDREIELRAEAQKLDREKFEAAEKRLAQMAEVADAAREGKVDPATVADEIDRILGRRK